MFRPTSTLSVLGTEAESTLSGASRKKNPKVFKNKINKQNGNYNYSFENSINV